MSKVPTSRYKGVSKHGDKWLATVYKDRKQIYLGVFPTEIEANEAVQYAKINNDYSIRSGYKENSTSKFKGIAKVRNKFMVTKTIAHHQYYVGIYPTEEIAVKVYSLVNTPDDIPKYRHYSE